MEHPNLNLPLTPNGSQVEQTIVVAGGGGSQPTYQAIAINEASCADPTSLPPKSTKKRRPNASGPRRTSTAWEHFIKLPESEAKDPTAACKYCGKKYLADTKSHGTSNLLHHLKNCPKYTYVASTSHDPNQTLLTFSPSKSGQGMDLATTSCRFDVDACRKAVAMFVTLDEQPFSIVEGEGFKYLCRQLQPQFSVLSRNTVARDCFQLFVDEKARLKASFRSENTRVALTTNCRRSIQNLSYLTLTAHFIDKDWKYQKRIISFCTVANHRGETIGKQVEDVLREWGLRNISTITVDNASSSDVAMTYLKKRIKNVYGLVLDGEFFHMRCCANILNLVVNDALKDMHQSIASIRNAVRFVKGSPHRLAKFKECIQFAGITSQKLVCLDDPTRWNSTYMMLDAAEKFQVAFEMLELEDTSYIEYFGDGGPPSSGDWENARAFTKFLKIFYDATKVFTSSVHVNIHSAFHQMASIYSELKQSTKNADSVLSNMGKEMKKKYDRYWGNIQNINQLLYFGVILDPRYKLNFVEWSFKDMYTDDPNFSNELTTSIKNNLSRMYEWYVTAHEQKNSTMQTFQGPLVGGSCVETFDPAEVPAHLARADAFKRYLREKNSSDKKNELERYLAEICVDGDDKFDLLVWWKHNSSRFPIVSSMARDVLATPVSAVAPESAFSIGDRVLDTFRSSLNPEMAEALICAQNWLRSSIYQFKDLNLNEEYETSEKIVAEYRQRSGSGTAARAGPSSSQSQSMIDCD